MTSLIDDIVPAPAVSKLKKSRAWCITFNSDLPCEEITKKLTDFEYTIAFAWQEEKVYTLNITLTATPTSLRGAPLPRSGLIDIYSHLRCF